MPLGPALGWLIGCMGEQLVASVAIVALLVAALGYLWVGQPPGGHADPVAVPSFSLPVAPPAAPLPPRPTLVPTDCTELLAGSPDVSALLGQPLGSVSTRTVIGQPSPSVGQLERVTCGYILDGRDAPGLVLTVAAFTDPDSANAQRERNTAAERTDTRTLERPALGGVSATLLREPGRDLLLASYGRYTVTASIGPGVAPGGADSEPVLADLTQRVLSTLLPPPRH